MSIIIAIIVFSAIVLFHEYGHFLLARKNGIKVLEFSLGLGPTLLKKKTKTTTYSLKALPFGGSCAMYGEEEDDIGEGSFGSKTVLQRLSVILAGPIFNFILAIILSILVVSIGGHRNTVINEVLPNSAASEAGLDEGDRIIKINDKAVLIWDDITLYNGIYGGEELNVTYEREGKKYNTTLSPKLDEETGGYIIGISNGSVENGSVIKYSYAFIRNKISSVTGSFYLLFSGKASFRDITGVVGIVSVIGKTYNSNITYGIKNVIIKILELTALLSLSLGVMNLIPFPALDGGRTVFLIIEGIRRKRINQKIEETINIIGFILLLILMVVVLINDFRFHL